MNIKNFIRSVPDFPKPGVLFRDITPLLASHEAFSEALLQMEYLILEDFDMFAAAESRGFLFAAPLADRMGKGLTILRKPGKLPYITHKVEYDLEYGKSEMHMQVDAVPKGARVVVVDDLLATGGTMNACCKLIEQGGGKVMRCIFAVELKDLGGREKLKGYKVSSLLEY
jgi:adenine phosphoribosyltransferase